MSTVPPLHFSLSSSPPLSLRHSSLRQDAVIPMETEAKDKDKTKRKEVDGNVNAAPVNKAKQKLPPPALPQRNFSNSAAAADNDTIKKRNNNTNRTETDLEDGEDPSDPRTQKASGAERIPKGARVLNGARE